MKKHSIKVALNMSKIPVPQKINRARFIVDSVMSHPTEFPNPVPTLSTITSAIDDLEIAWNDAVDGGKVKTALMHDKEDDLQKLLNDLANYVELVADGDIEVVHMSGMSVKKKPTFSAPDFEVEHSGNSGEVKLRVKPKAKTHYHWEYCRISPEENEWRFANETITANTIIAGLDPGVTYYFRVEYRGHLKNSYPFQPISIIVI